MYARCPGWLEGFPHVVTADSSIASPSSVVFRYITYQSRAIRDSFTATKHTILTRDPSRGSWESSRHDTGVPAGTTMSKRAGPMCKTCSSAQPGLRTTAFAESARRRHRLGQTARPMVLLEHVVRFSCSMASTGACGAACWKWMLIALVILANSQQRDDHGAAPWQNTAHEMGDCVAMSGTLGLSYRTKLPGNSSCSVVKVARGFCQSSDRNISSRSAASTVHHTDADAWHRRERPGYHDQTCTSRLEKLSDTVRMKWASLSHRRTGVVPRHKSIDGGVSICRR